MEESDVKFCHVGQKKRRMRRKVFMAERFFIKVSWKFDDSKRRLMCYHDDLKSFLPHWFMVDIKWWHMRRRSIIASKERQERQKVFKWDREGEKNCFLWQRLRQLLRNSLRVCASKLKSSWRRLRFDGWRRKIALHLRQLKQHFLCIYPHNSLMLTESLIFSLYLPFFVLFLCMNVMLILSFYSFHFLLRQVP